MCQQALTDQMATPEIDELAFEEHLGLLVDREITERENRRLTSRLRRARLRHAAALEDIDYRNPRGLVLINRSTMPFCCGQFGVMNSCRSP